MNYVVAAPPYDQKSAGVRALHRLAKDLEARMLIGLSHEVIPDTEIVIYPEVYIGNPFKAKNVVRYCLNRVGFFPGTDRYFPESEMLYYYSPNYVFEGREPENILTVPVVNGARFLFKTTERSGTCYLAIKNRHEDAPKDWEEITRETDLDELFQRASRLVTFDDSAINLEAELAGVEVEYRFQLSDWDRDLRLNFADIEKRYAGELRQFVERTQRRFENLQKTNGCLHVDENK